MEAIAKFKVLEVAETEHGAKVTLEPVRDGSQENKDFYKWTPGGSITLSTINPAVAAMFKPGKEFYVKFEEVK